MQTTRKHKKNQNKFRRRTITKDQNQIYCYKLSYKSSKTCSRLLDKSLHILNCF